jgi:hypothetical protein
MEEPGQTMEERHKRWQGWKQIMDPGSHRVGEKPIEDERRETDDLVGLQDRREIEKERDR